MPALAHAGPPPLCKDGELPQEGKCKEPTPAPETEAKAEAGTSTEKTQPDLDADFDDRVEQLSVHAKHFKNYCKASAIDTCVKYCTLATTAKIDYCALQDRRVAAVALAVAPEDLAELLRQLPVFDKDGKEVPDRGDDRSDQFPIFNLGGGELQADLADLGLRLAAALGKLALDRAKQEAVIWALDQLERNICSPENPALGHELSSYWLLHTCSFASQKTLDRSYGAGNDMLTNLVAAMDKDLHRMPGNVAGLLIGAAFWSESTSTLPWRMFNCYELPAPAGCESTHQVRLAATEAVTAMLRGEGPIDAYASFATRFDEIDRDKRQPDPKQFGGRFDAPALHVSVCAGALAGHLSLDDDRRPILSESTKAGDLERVVVGLIDSPVCWSIVGQGYPSVTQLDQMRLAVDRGEGKDVERLSTAIRITKLLHVHEAHLRTHWRELSRLGREIQVTIAKQQEQLELLADPSGKDMSQRRVQVATTGLTVVDQTLDIAGTLTSLLEDMLGGLAYAQLAQLLPGLMPESSAEEQWNQWKGPLTKYLADTRSGLDIGHALVRAGIALAREDYAAAMVEITAVASKLPTGVAETAYVAQVKVTGAKDQSVDLKALEGKITALEGHGPSQYVRKSKRLAHSESLSTDLEALAGVIDNERKACASQGAACNRELIQEMQARHAEFTARISAVILNENLIDKLLEFSGLIVTIVQAEDAEQLAEVLAKTTSPPGAWRRKQVPGSRTISLTSFVGLQGGAEWRRGQYGVTYERGDVAYFQSPTLAIPIGFDFAFGDKRRVSHGVFVPIIDPAAFLQYDVDQDSRLPGPRPLTVLAFGAMYRLGIPTTPLALLLGYTYRPKLRTWEPTVNEPGADAHQLAVMLAIDATLWAIVKR